MKGVIGLISQAHQDQASSRAVKFSHGASEMSNVVGWGTFDSCSLPLWPWHGTDVPRILTSPGAGITPWLLRREGRQKEQEDTRTAAKRDMMRFFMLQWVSCQIFRHRGILGIGWYRHRLFRSSAP